MACIGAIQRLLYITFIDKSDEWGNDSMYYKSTAYVISAIRLLKTTITLFILNHCGISSKLTNPYE